MVAYTTMWGYLIAVGIQLPKSSWFVGGLWALADPLFLYLVCYYFVKIKGGTPQGILGYIIMLSTIAYMADQIGVTTALLVDYSTVSKIFINLFCWMPSSNFVNSICLILLRTEIK